jgi:hypothetical protein
MRLGAAILLALFAPLELLSAWPTFHRHANELGRLLAPASAEIEARGKAAPPGSPDCPACTVSGLTAITSGSPSPAAPSMAPARFPRPAEAPIPVRRIGASRGRAPPGWFSSPVA